MTVFQRVGVIAGSSLDQAATQVSLEVGADTFVLSRDGLPDRIEDFDISQDKLDLSAWDWRNFAEELSVQTTNNGARIRLGNEELDLLGLGGVSFDSGQTMTIIGSISSYLGLSPRSGSKDAAVSIVGQSPVLDEPNSTPNPQPAPQPEFELMPSLEVRAERGLSLQGSDGDDWLTGSDDHDEIAGGGGNDTLEGGAGNDMLAGSGGQDMVRGGSGDDSMGGGLGNDTMGGGDGDDVAGGGRGNDVMYGDDGDDLLSGGQGNDMLSGGNGNDMLAGSFDHDTVIGGNGHDNLGGGSGKDTLLGGSGNDSMGGGEGDDRLEGGTGNDFIAGGGRSDLLFGGGGADTLNAGADDDTMSGGDGADTFVFNILNAGEYDVITDFNVNEDTLRLHGITGSSQSARFNNLDITETEQGTEIKYDGHTIMLQDVGVDELEWSDLLML